MTTEENKKIILYVDDEGINSTRKEILEGAGYLVISYLNHEEAKEDICKGLEFDVAVIDRATINSRTTGDDLIESIKSKSPKRLVISISAYDWKANMADHHIKKPLNAKQIIEYIEEVSKLK